VFDEDRLSFLKLFSPFQPKAIDNVNRCLKICTKRTNKYF